MVAIQNSKLALGVPKPHPAEVVGEFNHHACLRKILATAIGCPHTIGQAVQAVTSERNPHSSLAILGNGLEKMSLIRHLFRKVNANQFGTDQVPESAISAEPDRFVRAPVGESH